MFCMALFFVLCCVSCQPQANLSEQYSIKWRTLHDGQIEAAQRNMPVLVDFFYGEECMRCLSVQREIYDNSDIVAKIEENFIPVRVWLTKGLLSPLEETLSKRLDNNGECILAFLDAQGKVVKNLQGDDISSMGMLPAKDYVQYMNDALKMLK